MADEQPRSPINCTPDRNCHHAGVKIAELACLLASTEEADQWVERGRVCEAERRAVIGVARIQADLRQRHHLRQVLADVFDVRLDIGT
jgi:hypothetical protein